MRLLHCASADALHVLCPDTVSPPHDIGTAHAFSVERIPRFVTGPSRMPSVSSARIEPKLRRRHASSAGALALAATVSSPRSRCGPTAVSWCGANCDPTRPSRRGPAAPSQCGSVTSSAGLAQVSEGCISLAEASAHGARSDGSVLLAACPSAPSAAPVPPCPAPCTPLHRFAS
eukprot:331512-Pleurochrysis_carterae.AAC.1